MRDLGIPKLTVQDLELLCESAEQIVRDFVFSKISKKRISAFEVVVEAEGTKPISVNVDITIVLSPIMKDYDVEKLTNEAKQKAFIYIEKYLKELKCKLKK